MNARDLLLLSSHTHLLFKPLHELFSTVRHSESQFLSNIGFPSVLDFLSGGLSYLLLDLTSSTSS